MHGKVFMDIIDNVVGLRQRYLYSLDVCWFSYSLPLRSSSGTSLLVGPSSLPSSPPRLCSTLKTSVMVRSGAARGEMGGGVMNEGCTGIL